MLGRPEGVSPVRASHALRQAQGTSEELRNWLLRGIYRGGWRLAARLPARLIAVIISVISWLALRHNGRHVRTLRSNLMQTTGAPVGEDLVRAALASYFRAFYEVLALPKWSETDIRFRVTAINEAAVREAHAGPGAIVALPHSGNWDLAGAWACVTGMPVTTVAEQLPDREFADFVAFREGLGLQVLSHRDPGVLAALVEAIRRRRVVCLLADRDLTGTGVPVAWRGLPITMPAGPAILARRTGATLLPAVCQFTERGMVIIIGDRVMPRPGRAGLVAMMQDVADFFADTIARQPEDWHMMQPFFVDHAPPAEEAR
jgi:phosphatidylinositol dimannoside acyltransferase